MCLKVILKNDYIYDIFINGVNIGKIEKYYNKIHSNNTYLKCSLEEYDKNFSKDIFDEIKKSENKKLQIMIDSREIEKISFIEKAGFICMRKSYELSLSTNDLKYKNSRDISIVKANAGSDKYKECSKMLYKHYQKTHETINTLSLEVDEFMDLIPSEVYYYLEEDSIGGVAFIEENEIAYICLLGEHSLDFAYGIVSKVFDKYSKLLFECDDVDSSAMEFTSMFKVDFTNSHNTYVK